MLEQAAVLSSNWAGVRALEPYCDEATLCDLQRLKVLSDIMLLLDRPFPCPRRKPNATAKIASVRVQ